MKVEVVFTSTGCSSTLGNFTSGDRAFVSREHAAHLVDEARCARYASGEPPAPPADGEVADKTDRHIVGTFKTTDAATPSARNKKPKGT